MTAPQGLVTRAVGGDPVAIRLRPTITAGPPRSAVGGDVITGNHVISAAVTRWRTRPDSRNDPAMATIVLAAAPFTTIELPELGDTVVVELTAAALAWSGATDPWRFVGRVTDADARPATPRHPATVRLMAVGPQANLAVKIGAVPWPEHTDGDRADAILAAAITADMATDDYLAVATVDPGQVTVLAQDVDATAAAQLLEDLAADSGGELVEGRDGRLSWHDSEHRRGTTGPAVTLTTAQVLATPAWRKQLSGLVNDVTIGYGAATPQATLQVVDQAAVDRVGRHAASRGTQLVDQPTATSRANDLVGRWGRPAWRLEAITVDLTRSVLPAAAGELLGLSFADLIAVTALPDPAGALTDAQLWVEGITENLTRDAWRLQLAVSDFRLSGPATRWVDVNPAVTWATTPTDLSWLGAVGWAS